MRKLVTAIAVCSALLGVVACSPDAKPDEQAAASASADPSNPAVGPKVQLTGVTDGATDVSTAAEFGYQVAGANNVTVTLVDADGKSVPGGLREDASTWLPAKQLNYAAKYTLTATASKASGITSEVKATFTTMAQPADLVDVHSWIGDDQVVGVAMPVVVTFGLDVPENKRADIQRRLFVTSDPPQVGIWNWINPREAHFRPREHWKPGTKLAARFATGGLSWGVKNWVGKEDITIRATVGAAQVVTVDNATKRMTVTKDGQTVLSVPVSLGKPTAPSSSGALVVISRNPWEWFDSSTYGVPVTDPGGYRTKVEWTMRLTWQGEYIHAAPWSVKDQGKRNVSHGCVNIPTAEAHWLYDFLHVGDPVTVSGTEAHVKWGDGWTDWDRPWEEYVKGSAIPYEATPTPTPSRS
jgi:lipoprotein-anchoring transpeptidase ErfK/SrfK